jgi:tetratricopeptide (TPR) repeat protein
MCGQFLYFGSRIFFTVSALMVSLGNGLAYFMPAATAQPTSTLSPSQGRAPTASHVSIPNSSKIEIQYSAPAENLDSNLSETLLFLIVDRESLKFARVTLEETGPRSGVFSATAFVQIEGLEKPLLQPALFKIPRALYSSKTLDADLPELIRNQKLIRKPFFFKKRGTELSMIIFNQREEALAAYNQYLKDYQGKTTLDPDLLKNAYSPQVNLEDTLRLAEELYAGEKFQESAEVYRKVLAQDPQNTLMRFKLGVALYRLNSYSEAIRELEQAKPEKGFEPVERLYFMALAHLKQKNYPEALKLFAQVRAFKDKEISPMGAYFSGVIKFEQRELDEAQALFEETLDTATDPAVDRQAEAFIEQILEEKQILERQKRKWTLNLNLSLFYDSNILVAPRETEATGLSGYRLTHGVNLNYRPRLTRKDEGSLTLYYTDFNSRDDTFQNKKDFQDADPMMLGLSCLYRRQFVAWGMANQWQWSPGIDILHLNADKEGGRERLMDSYYLDQRWTLVIGPTRFSAVNFEIRRDEFTLNRPPTEVMSGNKFTLGTSQIWLLGERKSHTILADLSLQSHQAEGDNQKYLRYTLSPAYSAPLSDLYVFVGKLAYTQTDFFSHELSRKDAMISPTLVLQRKLFESIQLMLIANYSSNSSSLPTSSYDKYTIMTQLTWTGVF